MVRAWVEMGATFTASFAGSSASSADAVGICRSAARTGLAGATRQHGIVLSVSSACETVSALIAIDGQQGCIAGTAFAELAIMRHDGDAEASRGSVPITSISTSATNLKQRTIATIESVASVAH